jgi:hypothetical protein
MRYNFHEMLSKIKANPRFVLPSDINEPVYRFLDKIGCKIGCTTLRRLEQSVGYGQIELVRDDIPNAKISIDVAAGMVGEWKEFILLTGDKWTCISYKNVKNSNLDKRNIHKGELNGNGHGCK